MRRAIPLLMIFALAGQWITTPEGVRVCQLTGPLQTGMTLNSGFCTDWQPGFTKMQYGMTFPFSEGWVRPNRAGGYIQLNVEGKWVP